MPELKDELHRKLQASRAVLLSKLDGLSEYDRRRPMTPAGTNLLGLEAPGSVAHWPQDRRETTLGVLLIRMVAETAQHAGHADIIRELIDGTGGPDQDDSGGSARRKYLAEVQTAADTFAARSGEQPRP